jgi:hypothetical protein
VPIVDAVLTPVQPIVEVVAPFVPIVAPVQPTVDQVLTPLQPVVAEAAAPVATMVGEGTQVGADTIEPPLTATKAPTEAIEGTSPLATAAYVADLFSPSAISAHPTSGDTSGITTTSSSPIDEPGSPTSRSPVKAPPLLSLALTGGDSSAVLWPRHAPQPMKATTPHSPHGHSARLDRNPSREPADFSGSPAIGSAGLLFGFAAFAALVAFLSLAVPGLGSRLRLSPALGQPPAFVSLIERPG